MATSLHTPAPVIQEHLAQTTLRLPYSTTASETRTRVGKAAYWLSAALAVVTVPVCVLSLLIPGIFHDPAMTAGNLHGSALVILVVAVPAMAVSMILSTRGSVRGQIVWLASLAYILYYSLVFSFDVAFNELFPLYVVMLSLSLWSTVALVTNLHIDEMRWRLTRHVRPIGVYLLVVVALFALSELRDIVPALVSNGTPAGLAGTRMLTNPFHVINESILYPLAVASVIWLWQGRARGSILTGVLLVWFVIEAVSVTSDQVFGHIGDPGQSLAAVPLFATLAIVGLIPTIGYFRNLRQVGQ